MLLKTKHFEVRVPHSTDINGEPFTYKTWLHQLSDVLCCFQFVSKPPFIVEIENSSEFKLVFRCVFLPLYEVEPHNLEMSES